MTTLIVATWRMKVRKVTWKELGLSKPESIPKTLRISIIIFGAVMISMIVFEIIKDSLPTSITTDVSTENATSKFGNLKGN